MSQFCFYIQSFLLLPFDLTFCLFHIWHRSPTSTHIFTNSMHHLCSLHLHPSTRLIIINKNVFFNKYNTMAISSDIHPPSSTDRQKLTSQTVWGHELWHHSAVKGLWPWHCHEDPAASWLWYLTHSVQWEEDWWVHNKLLENPICAAPPNASAACCDVTWIIYTLLWDMFHMSFTIQQSSWMSTRLQWIQNH